jgi:uncharacterized protein YbjT (DUF2867 family)
MKIVVIGGTGLIGSKLVELLRKRGNEALAAAPNTGVNTITGEGLAEALNGADVVVDVSNSPSFEDEKVMEFFQASTRNLIAAEKAAGVKQHVILSIVGARRMPESGYMRAKVAQEDLVKASGVPYSILLSTQFFEFIERVVKETLDGDVYRLSPALMQPIVSDEVVAALADVTLGAPLNGAIEVGGPEAIAMDELGREVLSAREDPRRIVADVHARYFGTELNDQSLIPSAGARLGSLKFGDWLRQSITPD